MAFLFLGLLIETTTSILPCPLCAGPVALCPIGEDSAGLWSPSLSGLLPLSEQSHSCCSLTLIWDNQSTNHPLPVSERDIHKALLFSRISSCLTDSWHDVKRKMVHDALGCSVLSIFSKRHLIVLTLMWSQM